MILESGQSAVQVLAKGQSSIMLSQHQRQVTKSEHSWAYKVSEAMSFLAFWKEESGSVKRWQRRFRIRKAGDAFICSGRNTMQDGTDQSLNGYPITDDDMRMHLEERMSEDLGKVYLHANYAKEMENITDFDKWVEEVHVLNENLRNEVLHGKKLFQALLAQSSSSSATSSTSKSSCPPCGITDTTTTVEKTAEASTGSGLLKGSKTRPPHLTKSERELLMKHLGCFVCCQFYTDHIGIDCKEGSLDPATYCTLTEADGITAKKAYKDRKKTIIAGLTLHTTSLSALSDNEDMIGESSDSALTDDIDFD
ncbi:hypothetical protein F5146DRAFT_1006501 [Armillaria mellea]|nr:hypothetical protein F5146DRAFT_1006501 [Armillaria mellea]